MRRVLAELLVLVAIGAVVTLPWIGAWGLSNSEGHRVVPAIEMLETGNWLVPHLFEQPYVRKPQGVPWLFALALSLHDDPELSPRLVSALALVLTAIGAWFFARRWFGHGLAAGVVTLLTPVLWLPSRSAEIEMPNNLCACLTAWLVVDILRARRTRSRAGPLLPVALGASVFAMLLMKGPAGAPAILGLLIAGAVLTRSLGTLAAWRVWAPAILGAAAFAALWTRTLSEAGEHAVRQGPGAFMAQHGQALKLLGFVPAALLSALPMSLAMMFPWGPDARREHEHADDDARAAFFTARLMALGCACGLLVMLAMGISNERYTQPVWSWLGPLAAWALVSSGLVRTDWARRGLAVMMPHRRRIARALTLGSPARIASLLLAGSLVHASAFETPRRNESGREKGIALAQTMRETLEPGAYTIVANAMIEARPEMLLAIERTLEDAEVTARGRWRPRLAGRIGPRTLALIRTDPLGDESGLFPGARVIGRGTLHEFQWALVDPGGGSGRVSDRPVGSAPNRPRSAGS